MLICIFIQLQDYSYRKVAMAAFNYRDLIRLIPIADWLKYSESRNFEIKQSQLWNEADEATKQADIKTAIEALEGEQREHIYRELRQVYTMANARGMHALKNAVEIWDGITKEWDAMVSDAQRMLDALMRRPDVLRKAQAFLQADDLIGRRVWERLELPTCEDMSTQPESIQALEGAIGASFTLPKAKLRACEIDVLTRHLDGSVQLDIRLEADHQRNLEFAPDNRTQWRDVRPTQPMTVIYHPASGVLDMLVPGGKKAREKLLPILGEHLFGHPLQPQVTSKPLLFLNRLLLGLTPPTDSGFDLLGRGVTAQKLTHCRFKAQVEPAMDIELRTKPRANDLLTCITERKLQPMIGRGFTVDQATVSLSLAASAGGKERWLHMHLRPAGINNRADLNSEDLQMCEDFLKALGVMEQLDQAQEDVPMLEPEVEQETLS